MVKEYEIRDPRVPEQTAFQILGEHLAHLCCFQTTNDYERLRQDETEVRATASAYVAVSLACTTGLLFGYDIGCTSAVMAAGPNNGDQHGSTVTDWFSLSELNQSLGMSGSLIGAVLGSALLMALGDSLGNKTELALSGMLHTFGSLLSCLIWGQQAGYFWLVLAGRFIFGLGNAFAMHSAPAFIAEVAPVSKRELWITLHEASVVGGVPLGMLVAGTLGQLQAEHLWRWCFGLAAAPACAVLVGFCWLPPSPNWLRVQAYQHPTLYHRDDALAAMQSYRAAEAHQVLAEMVQIEESLSRSVLEVSSTASLCGTMKHRAALAGTFGLLATQHVSGQSAVLYYAVTILTDAGFGENATLAASAVACVKLIVAVCARGRGLAGSRKRLVGGVLLMTAALVGAATAFHLSPIVTPPLQQPRYVFSANTKASLLLCLGGFVGGWQLSFGSVCWAAVREVGNPLRARGAAALVVGFSNSLAITGSYLLLLKAVGHVGSFILYASMSLLSLAFVCFWVPETVGNAVEQQEPLDAQPTLTISATDIQAQSLGSNTISTRNLSSDSLSRRSPATSPDLSPANTDRSPSPKPLVTANGSLVDVSL
jgi:hypothetical protein